jgi:RecB family exonuclease
MQVSHSMLSTWRRCRRRFYWNYSQGYRPIEKARGLSIGSAGHAAMEKYYSGGTPDEAVDAAIKSALADGVEEGIENLELVLRRYFMWAKEHDDFSIVSLEKEFYVPLDEHTLKGIVDGIITRKDGTNWVLEHKFNKQVTTNHLAIDPQCSIYIAGLGALGIAVSGVLYNIVRTTEGGIAEKQPVVRDYVFRTEHSAQLIQFELLQQAREVDMFLSSPKRDQNGMAYRNPNKDCSWDCEFYNACLSVQDDGDLAILKTKFTKNKWRKK